MKRPKTVRTSGCAIRVSRSGNLWRGEVTSQAVGLHVLALHRRRAHLLHEVAAALGITRRRADYWDGMAWFAVTRLDCPATARG